MYSIFSEGTGPLLLICLWQSNEGEMASRDPNHQYETYMEMTNPLKDLTDTSPKHEVHLSTVPVTPRRTYKVPPLPPRQSASIAPPLPLKTQKRSGKSSFALELCTAMPISPMTDSVETRMTVHQTPTLETEAPPLPPRNYSPVPMMDVATWTSAVDKEDPNSFDVVKGPQLCQMSALSNVNTERYNALEPQPPPLPPRNYRL